MHILLIGNLSLPENTAQHLRSTGMTVTAVSTIEEGIEMKDLYLFDAIVCEEISVNPEFAVRQLRKSGSKLPVLVLSKGVPIKAMIAALDAGADDYVTKPCHFSELVARIRVIARRTTGHVSSEITVGDLRINLDQAGIAWVKEKKVSLTRKEYATLEFFMRRPELTITREKIVDYIYGATNTHVEERTIDVHMNRLRRKLTNASEGPDYFRTIRGIGFSLSVVKSEPEKV